MSSLNRYDKLENCEVAATTCAALKKQLDEAEAKARLFNSREALFGKTCEVS